MKCKYCRVECGGEFCCQEHKALYERAAQPGKGLLALFALGLCAGLGLVFWGALGGSGALVGGGVAVVGAVILLLPFPTPQTVELVGMRNAQRLARALGVFAIAAGVWIGWF